MGFESTLALTSVQRGMVFHHLVDPRSGVDIEQLVTTTGRVDPSLLGLAWQALVARHATLRRYPVESGSGEYRLLLAEGIAVELAVYRDHSLDTWLAADRARGFDLLRAPPVRLALLEHDGGSHVVLTVHHLLIDGRSFPPVLVDLWDAYDALVAGREPESPERGEAAAYVDTLSRRDPAPALSYWSDLLGKVSAATPFPELAAPGASDWQLLEHRIEGDAGAAMIRAARALDVGLHILVQAAWATALARRLDTDSVVFGAVRAGRGPASSGAHDALGTLITTVPVLGEVADRNGSELLADLAAQHRAARAHEHVALATLRGAVRFEGSDSLFHTLLVYDRDDLDDAVHRLRPDWTHRHFALHERTPYPVTLYAYGEERIRFALAYDANALHPSDAQRLLRRVAFIAASIAVAPSTALRALDVLLPEERELSSNAGSGPTVAVDAATVIDQFERCAADNPLRIAVVAGMQQLRYDELAARVDALAGRLAAAGAGAGTIVGLSLDRSLELPIAMLAVLRAGAAYLPLDPDYPAERIAYCLRDSGATLVLTQRHHAGRFTDSRAHILCVDEPGQLPQPPVPVARPMPADLAYLIYTSGSTGEPKGVEVAHANVANFFAGMDARIRLEGERRWLAVTSPSFDISVLELLWTLCRGFEVVVHGTRAAVAGEGSGPSFSLFHFASGFDADAGDPYRLIREAARFADDHGFEAIWSPERHFHEFGAPYPSPAVMNAALATMTKRVKLRAGSVVLPLHDAFRVTEDWALVDCLSGGRVGISFAAGWQPNDFVLAPQNYERRKELMFEQIEAVRTLWRGGKLTLRNPRGDEVSLGTYPRPVQPELPVWITAAGSPDTFARAGACGANILTHLLGQTVEELRRNIDTWRRARAEAGHDPTSGRATVMVHTFLGADTDRVREQVREPLKRYLRSAAGLVGAYADAWTAFKQGAGAKVDGTALDQLSPEQKDELYDFAFERYFESSGLFGTPERALTLAQALRGAGADEIACLIDFGVDTQTVIAHLPWIARLRDASARAVDELEHDVVRDIDAHRITHMQCTPSLARMVPMLSRGGTELATLRELLVGGEALPPDLARELYSRLHPDARILNMYGPTETTVWSTVAEVPRGAERIHIGSPIVNTGCHVVDSGRRPVPPGQAGELLISGAGVTRGYHRRSELTMSRFVDIATRAGTTRAYATGDLVRLDPDGTLSYLGRTDFQIKVRGHRIEPGEIEARLRTLAGVRDAVVVARDDSVGTRQLVAYVAVQAGVARPDQSQLREQLRQVLPDHLVPDACVVLEALPLTPNGKVDRNALPDPRAVRAGASAEHAPNSDAERKVHDIWCQVLGLSTVGRHANFFELGGHSILAVKVQAELAQAFGQRLPIVELFRAPTLAALAARFAGGAPATEVAVQRGSERAQQRRAALKRRGGSPEADPR